MFSAPPKGILGFSIYVIILFIAYLYLPPLNFKEDASSILFVFGFLALWRYTWGLLHFFRSLLYRSWTFPKWRAEANEYGIKALPSKIYILITSFRIDTEISLHTIKSAIKEAKNCDIPCTLVAVIVEKADEDLYRTLFNSYDLPDYITLTIVKARGVGKRDALARGYKAISLSMPPEDAVVAVMDGDTAYTNGGLKKCLPFFKMMPKLGALTTDELPLVDGNKWQQEWYKMRFAQRHILMSSLSLSKRVMTLTGRLSLYRASIITHPDFIEHMLEDHLSHWRLGKFKFLTGDDKSSLFWVLKQEWQQIYVPDVKVIARETWPNGNFLVGSSKLMLRWFGNMLRTNHRIVKLGFRKMPFFTWWSFIDQKLSMWTSLSGPIFAIMLSIHYTPLILFYYMVWIGFIRMIMSAMLLSARYEINWRYPFLLYYNQVYGALVKTYVLFHLDKQAWTRQKIFLNRNLSKWRQTTHVASSCALQVTAYVVLILAIGFSTQTLSLPDDLRNLLLSFIS